MISRFYRHHLLVLIASACLLILFTSSWGIAGENYSSSDVKYPDGFRGNNNNLTVQMQEFDAVNLQGNQVIFFSVSTKDDQDIDGYDDNLYYYLPEAKDIPHGSVMITNNYGSFPFSDNFNFKACVFNDIANIFYTPMADWGNYNTSSIYYLTFYFNDKTNKWTFGPVNGFPTGVPGTSISFAEVMNGEMYVFFTSQGSGGYDWYYMKTSDGQSFGTG